MSAPLVIIVPVLSRPQNVAPLLESIRRSTSVEHQVLFMGSPGNDEEHDEIRSHGADLHIVDGPHPGDYARKINIGARRSRARHIFMGADDLRFHEGWYEAALEVMRGAVAVVGTNDLGAPRVMRGKHSTHSLATRDYMDTYGTVDQAGVLLHEGYHHVWVDDEFVSTAKRRRAFAFAADSRVEHLHPSWEKAEDDEVYQRGIAQWDADAALYKQRRKLWRRSV